MQFSKNLDLHFLVTYKQKLIMQRFWGFVLGLEFLGKDKTWRWKKDWKELRCYQVSGEPQSQTLLVVPSLLRPLAVELGSFFIKCFPKETDKCFLFSTMHWTNPKIALFFFFLVASNPTRNQLPDDKAGFLSEPVEAFFPGKSQVFHAISLVTLQFV